MGERLHKMDREDFPEGASSNKVTSEDGLTNCYCKLLGYISVKRMG
jgi:hypothetical protein